jgi:hypothetical protein
MQTGGPALVALALTALLTGCLGKSDPAPPATAAAARCAVTQPGGKVPHAGEGVNYGNEALGVVLWPKGTLVADPLPDGSSYADIEPDGSVVAKLGWWRVAKGRLGVEGERLDAAAPPLRADVPAGHGSTGFQPTEVTFPSPGCWKVVGSVGDASLTFVVRVVT